MKAAIYQKKQGISSISIEKIPKPKPAKNQVLVKVHASSLTHTETHRFAAKKKSLVGYFLDYVQKPTGRPLGSEISGIIQEVGSDIKHFHVGQEVFGQTGNFFPIGAWAEYVLVQPEWIASKPARLSHEEAALLPSPAKTALGVLRRAKIKKGDKVLIYGASGGVGLTLTQFVRTQGANITGVCSVKNFELAKKAGCYQLVDYKTGDFHNLEKDYNFIFAVNGTVPFSILEQHLAADGQIIAIGGSYLIKSIFLGLFKKHIRFYSSAIRSEPDYLVVTRELIDRGQLHAFLDSVFPLEDVQKAISYSLNQHPKGKIAIKIHKD